MQSGHIADCLKTSLHRNKSEIPSPQPCYCRKRYFPFPCPETGLMIPCSASSLIRSEALDGLRSITFIASERPKIVWPGKASRSFNIWLTVFGWKAFSMSAFKASMSGFSVFSNAPLICNVRLCNGWFSFRMRLRMNVSRYSVVS